MLGVHEDLKQVPVAQRPKMLPPFEWSEHWWRTRLLFGWTLALLVPVGASVFTLWGRTHKVVDCCVIAIAGLGLATILVAILQSGRVSSNQGTYFRETEPVRYWVSTFLVFAMYLWVIIGSVYRKPENLPAPPAPSHPASTRP